MPTKNLVVDYGGVGDGQRATLTATITSGTGALSVSAGTGTFAPGDATHAIAIWSGNNYYFGTITVVTDADHITISPNIAFALAGVSVDILWGTDNTNAFTGVTNSWRAYAQTQTDPNDIPILQIPDGNFAYRTGGAAGQALHVGVLNSVKITGLSGNAANCKLMQLSGTEMRFGTDPAIVANRGLTNSGGNSARLQTASAHATSVFLVDPTTYGARIVVGRVCLLAAYDMQGLYENFIGYPPNGFFFEWNVITAYNSSTGQVTLQTPLTQTYKSTYPRWGLENTVSGSDQGGPFTIWVTPDGYNNTVTLENFTVDSPHNQCATHMRNWVANNLVMNSPGLYPTQNDTVELNNCVYSQQLEIDKMVNQVTWNNCTIHDLKQQSASPNRMYLNGGTIDTLQTAKYTECNNVAFGGGTLQVGVSSYGRTDRVVLNNCTGIGVLSRGGGSTDDLGGTSGTGSKMNASDFYTFVGGVIKFAKTLNDGHGGTGNPGQSNPTRLFAPGTWFLFDDKYIDQIADVYEDGTYCYVQFANTTAWPFTPVARLLVHPCPDFTMINCTGTAPELEDWNQAAPRIPLYSYSKRTIVGGPTAATAAAASRTAQLFGRLVTEKINVTVPYVGAGTLTFKDNQFVNRVYAKQSDYVSTFGYGNTINMKTGSIERVIRAATTATGAQTGDTLMNLTSLGEINLKGGAPQGTVFSANVTNGETPTVTVEYIMDQGIPAAVQTAISRLRLRLHT